MPVTYTLKPASVRFDPARGRTVFEVTFDVEGQQVGPQHVQVPGRSRERILQHLAHMAAELERRHRYRIPFESADELADLEGKPQPLPTTATQPARLAPLPRFTDATEPELPSEPPEDPSTDAEPASASAALKPAPKKRRDPLGRKKP